MLSHKLESMVNAGMKVELLPSIAGAYRVKIITSGKKVVHGESLFSLVRAVENAEKLLAQPQSAGR